MTVKKALKAIEILVEGDKLIVESMNKCILEWTKPDAIPDFPAKTAMMLRDISQINIHVLGIIKEEIQPRKQKCSHPKKFHDKDPNGQLYCTSCNEDL